MSMMGNDLNLTATVDANVQPWDRAMERAQASTARWEHQLGSLEADLMLLEKSIDDHANAALKRQHDALDKTGKAWFTFGAAAVLALGWATHEAMKWESAWAGVTKTTSGSSAEMNQLEDDLRSLTKILPTTHEEIAAVAEAAGQLGVAREDIAAFTEVAVNLGNATDLSAEDAATSLAQLMNIMRTAPDLVDHLGNTLVALGNNGASTESQILAMALRVAGAGHMIGMTEDEVLGLSSAMANLGIQSELGGGAIQRVMLIINTAVDDGGDALQGFANIAGTTAEAFASKWQTDPVRALDTLLQGMGHIDASGGNLVTRLADVGIKGTQNLQVMLRLAGAGTMLTKSIDDSSNAWEKNNALLIEVEKRYGTTESKVALARNELVDSAIDIGNLVLPALAGFVTFVSDVGRAWQDLPGPVRDAAIVLGIATTAIALFGGAAMMAVPKIAAFKAAVAQLEAGTLKTAGNRLMGFGSLLTGPWGLALAGGTVALGYFAAKHGEAIAEIDALTATLDKQTGAITDNSREWVIKKLSDDGVLSSAKSLGLDLGMVTEAALGNKDAISALASEYTRLQGAMPQVSTQVDGKTYSSLDTSAPDYLALKKVRDALDGTNGTLDEARQKWSLESEAKEGSAASSQDATAAQQGTTAAWKDGADAAGDMAGEVATLGEELADLSATYLDNRDAARAVRESLRGIKDAVAAYRKEHGDLDGAFRHGTKSGDEFGGMLDGLARDYQKQIETVEKLGGSEKRVQAAYDRSRDKLIDVAMQLGRTRKQAENYVDQVLQTPEIVQTHFLAPGLSDADARLERYSALLREIPEEVHTRVVQEMQIMGIPGPPAPSSPASPPPKSPKKKHREDGGFSFGTGGYVPRVSQIAPGGADIHWAEPSTGWEAYISGKPGMEGRNRQIWAETGRRLGVSAGGTTKVIERVIERHVPVAVNVSIGGEQFDAKVDQVARTTYKAESDYEHAMGGRG